MSMNPTTIEEKRDANVRSWRSALGGLGVLSGQMDLWHNQKQLADEIGKIDKKKIKTAVRFIKYILKNI